MSRLTHTPRYHAWRDRLVAALGTPGAPTELATFMAGERGQSLAVWRVNISRILADPSRVINAEDLLAITAWLDARKPARPPRRRPSSLP